MGFYFRKSKSFGLFRLNFSKSGVGVSTGVKGARLSVGPTGTYINLGRNGIYYRKKLDSSSKRNNDKKNVATANNSEKEYELANKIHVSDTSTNTSGNEIIGKIKRARITMILWIILSAILIVAIHGWGLLFMVVSGIAFIKFFVVKVQYDLDADARLEWEKCLETLSTLKTSKKIWIVEKSKQNRNLKYNAGASRDISRLITKIRKIRPNVAQLFLKADVSTIRISAKGLTIIFLPSEILIQNKLMLVSFPYNNLKIYASTTNFIERSSIPKDAEIIRYTWQYVNKDGSPDKRFANNPKIPVCRYGFLQLCADDKLSIEMHVSNKIIAQNVGLAYEHYREYISRIAANTVREESNLNDSIFNENPKVDQINLDAPKSATSNEVMADKESENDELVNEILCFLKEEDV